MPKSTSELDLPGCDPRELLRSKAALHVGRAAEQAQLFFSHFEHRAHLPLPAGWMVPGREHELSPPSFQRGVLAESKYQSFRHDSMVASFHPAHADKWTAHELCHRLVGFAWRRDASPYFHALAAWLAELVPVALWYFFDEPDLPRREKAGREFVTKNLAALAKSKRLGRPVHVAHGAVDLASDGVAYAHAHGPRLRSEELEIYTSSFFRKHEGLHGSLDALEARALAVVETICTGAPLPPWRAGEAARVAQDAGFRLLTVRASADKHAKRALDGIVEKLARDRSELALEHAVGAYEQLAERFSLTPAEQVFATGYGMPKGYGSLLSQLEAGIRSACPNAHHALGRERRAAIEAFADEDLPMRTPIGRRFADWLDVREPGPIADLASSSASGAFA